MRAKDDVRLPTQGVCKRCGYISSMEVCKACKLLDGLNRGMPKIAIGKTSKADVALNKLSNIDL